MKTKNPLSDYLENAFNLATYAINITDLKGTILHVNQAYINLYKYNKPEDLIGQTPRVIKSPKTPRSVHEDIWKTIIKDEIWEGDITNADSEGKDVYVHITITPIKIKGKKIGYMGFTIDRGQQVTLEKQLLHANKLVILGTIGAGLAHELNNPMTSISLDAEFILETVTGNIDEAKKKELETAATTIVSSIERMKKVIDHLLIYSRKSDSEIKEPIEISTLLEDSLLLLKHQLSKQDIFVELKIEKQIYTLGNSTNLESVFHNLLTNSKDAFADSEIKNGKITIEVKVPDDKWINIKYTDNAGGIPGKTIGEIFDPFFTTKDEGKGTGLGLAITRKIIVEHGGFIQCSSRTDKTTFLIKLPKHNIEPESVN